MPKRIYKPTEILRATVDRNCRAVLAPDPDAHPGCYRMVQVITPTEVYIGFEDTAPDVQAGGRDYVMGNIPGGSVIAPFPVMADQTLYMMSASLPGTDKGSMALATLIVQHWQDLSA